jgi:hypothetical protein
MPPDMGALTIEYKKSLPPEQQAAAAGLSGAEKKLETLEILALARKKSTVRATFTAYAYTWTGEPAPESGEPSQEGKRKRT